MIFVKTHRKLTEALATLGKKHKMKHVCNAVKIVQNQIQGPQDSVRSSKMFRDGPTRSQEDPQDGPKMAPS